MSKVFFTIIFLRVFVSILSHSGREERDVVVTIVIICFLPHTDCTGTLMSSQNGGSKKFSHLSTTYSDLDSSYIRTPPDFLSVVFDLDPYAWAGKANRKEEGLQSLLRAAQDVCVFLNAHTALRHDNACALYAARRSRG